MGCGLCASDVCLVGIGLYCGSSLGWVVGGLWVWGVLWFGVSGFSLISLGIHGGIWLLGCCHWLLRGGIWIWLAGCYHWLFFGCCVPWVWFVVLYFVGWFVYLRLIWMRGVCRYVCQWLADVASSMLFQICSFLPGSRCMLPVHISFFLPDLLPACQAGIL